MASVPTPLGATVTVPFKGPRYVLVIEARTPAGEIVRSVRRFNSVTRATTAACAASWQRPGLPTWVWDLQRRCIVPIDADGRPPADWT